ncbi:MAG: divergent PAP2 family protein [bacterium]|nr:divergent PAP2 family protein [bacterium]
MIGFKVIKIYLLAVASAQFLKIVFGYVREHKINVRYFIETGGMPSSHSAGVASLSTSVGIVQGFKSIDFAIALLFSLIVMYEATGLRREAGRQAQAINKLIDVLIHDKKQFEHKKLQELLGHTPLEVLSGTALGIVFALAFF